LWRVLPLLVGIVVVVGALTLGLRFLGAWGDTAIERHQFENSYQRKEAIKAQIANDEAVLAEINRKLQNPHLDPNTRANLEAHAAATRIRLSTTRKKQ
jgi:hypothetical protein